MKAKKSTSLSGTALAPAPLPPADRPEPLAFLSDRRRPWIMGVLNATPDSFYPGARFTDPEEALGHAERLIHEGADVIDLGAESTRPGSAPVPTADQLFRLFPILQAIRQRWPDQAVSIDTQKASVARQALEAGAKIINDISALRHDPEMASVVAEARCGLVLMHMQGTPATMQQAPRYRDVVGDVKSFLEDRLAFAVKHGISERRIILDPGIGFGKTLDHNVALLQNLSQIAQLGRPVLVGVSRKLFLGRLAAPESEPLLPEQRLEASIAANLFALQQGARGLRVHDVAATRRALNVWSSLAVDSPRGRS